MSTSFTKTSRKRQRTTSNTSENSFVKSVTSRVSGLLPATITKWFTNTSPNSNGSAPRADTDSSTEDEGPYITPRIPPNRMLVTPPGIRSNYDARDVNSSDSDAYTSVEFAPGRETVRHETSFASTPNKINDNDNRKEKNVDKPIFKSQHTVLTTRPSVATKRKSLFDLSPKRTESMSTTDKALSSILNDSSLNDSKEPYFKPAVLASSFYSGSTRYGGAASYYMDYPNIKRKKFAVVNESEKSNDRSIMSTSTRHIMDLLENYSSPLKEARRIPYYTKPSPSPAQVKPNYSNAKITGCNSQKYRELYVPNIAEVLRYKQKSRLSNMTDTARQILASHSSTQPISYPATNRKQRDTTENESGEILRTKVVKRVSLTQRGGNIDNEDTVKPLVLPSNPLQIDGDNLPKFSFENTSFLNPVTSTAKSSPMFTTWSNEPILRSTSTQLPKQEKGATNAFKFSNPIRVSCDTFDSSVIPVKFALDVPVDKKVETKIDAPPENQVKSDVTDLTGDKKKGWECSDCWVKNEADAKKCVCCGGKPSIKAENTQQKCIQCKNGEAQPNSKTCVNCSSVPCVEKSTSSFNQLTKDDAQWKCAECWVNNKSGDEKCICCGVSKPMKSSPTPVTSDANIDKDWKCNDCWVSNNSNSEKCVACFGAKPGLKATDAPSKIENSITFKKIAKTQKIESWECPVCLVSNRNNLSMCSCCGEKKELDNALNVKFNFGTNQGSSNTFKFGIDLKAQEASISKNPEINLFASDKSKVEKSEANNNSLAETPSFTFTLPEKKPAIEPASSKAEQPKLNFKFGIPSGLNTSPNGVTKPVEADEKAQEVPSVNLLQPKTVSDPLNDASSTGLSSTALNAPIVKPPSVSENKETVSFLPLPSTSVPRDTPQSTANFKFSVEEKPSAVFNVATTSALSVTTMSFAPPTQSNSLTTPASTMLFQKPAGVFSTNPPVNIFTKSEPTATSTVSLFPSPGDITSSVPATTATSATKFVFGANATQNNASSTEKPSFLFTFGNNKTDTSQVFKPVFGSTTDSGANKFGITPLAPNTLQTTNTLPTTNTPGGNNALSPANATGNQNMVSGPSGMSANNTLIGNGFGSGNTLGGSGFGSNIMSSSNAMNTNHTLGGPSIDAGNHIGTNPLNVGLNLGGNTLSSGGAMPTTENALGGTGLMAGNALGVNTLPAPGLGTNIHGSNNNMFGNPSQPPAYNLQNATPATPIFGQTMQKENMWSLNNSTPNLNMSNEASKKPAFSFGASPTFNSTNATPAFGGGAQVSNVFGMNQTPTQPHAQAPNQGSMFSTPMQNQPAHNIFGTPSMGNNLNTPSNIFGTPSVGGTPNFGAPNAAVPSFETPSLAPAPAPTFNFGAPQPTGMFAFGQQNPNQAPGVYNFSAASAPPQVQFNMGTAPATTGRRLRKAVRRTCQR